MSNDIKAVIDFLKASGKFANVNLSLLNDGMLVVRCEDCIGSDKAVSARTILIRDMDLEKFDMVAFQIEKAGKSVIDLISEKKMKLSE